VWGKTPGAPPDQIRGSPRTIAGGGTSFGRGLPRSLCENAPLMKHKRPRKGTGQTIRGKSLGDTRCGDNIKVLATALLLKSGPVKNPARAYRHFAEHGIIQHPSLPCNQMYDKKTRTKSETWSIHKNPKKELKRKSQKKGSLKQTHCWLNA